MFSHSNSFPINEHISNNMCHCNLNSDDIGNGEVEANDVHLLVGTRAAQRTCLFWKATVSIVHTDLFLYCETRRSIQLKIGTRGFLILCFIHTWEKMLRYQHPIPHVTVYDVSLVCNVALTHRRHEMTAVWAS